MIRAELRKEVERTYRTQAVTAAKWKRFVRKLLLPAPSCSVASAEGTANFPASGRCHPHEAIMNYLAAMQLLLPQPLHKPFDTRKCGQWVYDGIEWTKSSHGNSKADERE